MKNNTCHSFVLFAPLGRKRLFRLKIELINNNKVIYYKLQLVWIPLVWIPLVWIPY